MPVQAPARVLIVEDEVLIAMMLEELVAAFGYEVIAATPSGERAVELALKERPDLVLMDVALRGRLSGIQAAEAIGAERECAIIFMTAYDDPEMRDKMMAVPGATMLRKPFKEDVIQGALNEALAKKRLGSV